MEQKDDVRAALNAALSRIDIQCDEEQKELLIKHLDLLFEKNKQINLTRITSLQEAVVLHVEDSLSVLPEFNSLHGSFCDIGTGGGFPGIPLGVVTQRNGTLLDSVKKKAHAVQGFIEELGLEFLEAVPSRSEEFSKEHPGEFDTVIARAVSSLNVVEELAAPLLRYKGQLVAMRGIESSDDEKVALRASEDLGFQLVSKRVFEIGEAKYSRSVYVFEKVGEPSINLPRRPGMAVKRPLGIS